MKRVRRPVGAVRPARERNALATRAAILAAARVRFREDGFGASVRDIAAYADVNVALINRYFGTKEALFVEAVGRFDVSALFEGPREGFGARLARYALNKPLQQHDPILILLRSAGHPAGGELLRTLIDRSFVAPLAAWMGGPQARERAALVAGELLGLSILRDVIESASTADPRALERHVAHAIQGHVDRG